MAIERRPGCLTLRRRVLFGLNRALPRGEASSPVALAYVRESAGVTPPIENHMIHKGEPSAASNAEIHVPIIGWDRGCCEATQRFKHLSADKTCPRGHHVVHHELCLK